MARQPKSLDHLETDALSDAGDLVETEVVGIGTNTISDRLESDQIVFNLSCINMGGAVERRLPAAKRCIRDTVQLSIKGQRYRRHRRLRAEPSPGGDDRCPRQRK